ncbi:MAG: twin-arginine translocase TatA/TatE family subunit [Deltaproteobacteria bacterium]|jgi:sec-independent protein translocase protein TatA|nr:twin-arginine translocase TatA/TatE family subunit [Deltaproteobacteria bacterium]
MFSNVNLPEIILILVVIVVIFGGKRLPELGRGLGQGLRNFRKALSSKDDPEATNGQAPKNDPPDQNHNGPKA